MSEMFSPFNPMKILRYSDRILPLIKEGKIPIPVMVSFDFANPCNHKCIWCSWVKHRREEGGFLKPETFYKILGECIYMGVRGYEVCGGGEPLLNPYADQFIQSLGRNGEVLLITNGSHLTKDIAKFCRTIRVSLDASTERTHRELHRSNDFKIIIKNVQESSQVTRVGTGFLICPWNYTEIPSFVEMSKELGCKFSHIRPCFTDYPEIRETVGFDWFTWSKYYENEVLELIDQAKDYEDKDFKVWATFYKTKPKRDWKFKKCYASYFNPLITPTGSVYICCERRGVPESKIGVVGVDGSFKEIWFSKKHKELVDKCPNYLCPAKSKFLGYNRVIWEAFIEKKYDLEWI